MPKRKRSTTRRKRKKVKKRNRRRRIPRVFPKSYTSKLTYVDTVTLDCTVNAGVSIPVQYNFRANSIYDPDLTGTGHQPMGRDQFTALYDHYTVIGAKLTAKFFTSRNWAAVPPMWVGGITLDTPNTFTNISDILEQPNRAKGGVLPFSTYDGKGPKTVTLHYSPRKMFKLGRGSIVGNSRICAQSGSDPEEDATFSLMAVPPEQGSITNPLPDPAPISCLVKIEYIVVFSERRPISMS